MEKCIYIISVILIFLTSILFKKTEGKQNFIKALLIITGVYMCYNAFIAFIFHLINLKINLVNVAIVNLIISGFFFYKICKNKIQKYEIIKEDILFLAIYLYIIAVVFSLQFGFFNCAKFCSSDVGEHYKATMVFSREKYLLKDCIDTKGLNPTHMPLGYVNEGLIMQVVADTIGNMNTFKLYCFLDFSIYALCGIAFFYLAREKCEKKGDFVLVCIMTILYILGYPLNSMITGFHYLHLGLLIISIIMMLLDDCETYKDKCWFKIALGLLNLGIMFSYNLFVPIVYGMEFLLFIKMYQKKSALLNIITTLVIPGVIGVTYYFISKNTQYILNVGIKAEGYIFRNIWSSIIFYVPFTIYYWYRQIKEGKIDCLTYMILFTFGFTIFTYLACREGIMSLYYFYKMYYLLWLVLVLGSLHGMLCFKNISKKTSIITFIIVALFCIFIMIGLKFFDYNIKKMDEVSDEGWKNIAEIYMANTKWLTTLIPTIDTEEYEGIKYMQENINFEENKVIMITDNRIKGTIVNTIFDDRVDYMGEKDGINKWNNSSDYKYIFYTIKAKNEIENQKIIKKNNLITIVSR